LEPREWKINQDLGGQLFRERDPLKYPLTKSIQAPTILRRKIHPL
jgi:hypothetical protein